VVEGEEPPNDWMVRHDFLRSFEGCAQAVAVEALCGASDPRLHGIAPPRWRRRAVLSRPN